MNADEQLGAEVAVSVEYDPRDLRKQRRRARIPLIAVAKRLDISAGALSQYETGKKPLPFDLTGEDYETALSAEIVAKRAVA